MSELESDVGGAVSSVLESLWNGRKSSGVAVVRGGGVWRKTRKCLTSREHCGAHGACRVLPDAHVR